MRAYGDHEMTSPMLLPISTIQPSFAEVLHDVHEGLIPSDYFWVSCYKSGQNSVHAKARAELDEVNREAVNITLERDSGDNAIEVKLGTDGRYAISCDSLGIQSVRLYTPVQEYRDQERSNPQRPSRVTAFDVAPDGSQYATGFLDGTVFISTITPFESGTTSSTSRETDIPPRPEAISVNPKSRRSSKPHASNVTSLRFFPSSRVLLSASADFSLSILPADLPESAPAGTVPMDSGARVQPVRVLRGHNRPISSMGILGRGKNIVSTSLDQTVKLWDVPSGSIISTLYAFTSVTASTLGDRVPLPPHGDDQQSASSPLPTDAKPDILRDQREIDESQTKLVYCGLQNGTLQVFDLGSNQTVFKTPSPLLAGGNEAEGLGSGTGPISRGGAIIAIEHNSAHNLLATASSNGIVKLYDTRSLHQPLTSFMRNEAGIENLAFLSSTSSNQPDQNVGLAITANDGLPYYASVVPQGPGVVAEFVGPDCDAVRHVKVRDSNVWMVGDDSVVRRYIV